MFCGTAGGSFYTYAAKSLDCENEDGSPGPQCRRFSELYTDGKHMLDKLWDGAFTYEEDETVAYNLFFDAQEETGAYSPVPNPNDNVMKDLSGPAPCTAEEHDEWVFYEENAEGLCKLCQSCPIKGDMNDDGVVDVADVDILVAFIAARDD